VLCLLSDIIGVYDCVIDLTDYAQSCDHSNAGCVEQIAVEQPEEDAEQLEDVEWGQDLVDEQAQDAWSLNLNFALTKPVLEVGYLLLCLNALTKLLAE